MTLDTFQLGEPVEHRGIVVTPLFPRRDPVAAYITLDEALPRGLRDHGDVRLGLACPSSPSRTRLDEHGAALRRRGARRREAEPDPERERPRRRRREAADPRLVRRAGPLAPAQRRRSSSARRTSRTPTSGAARQRCSRRSRSPAALAQGEVWDEVREKQTRMGVALADRGATATRSRRTPSRLRALEDAFALAARTVRRRARPRRRPLPRLGLPARRVRAPLAEAPRRLPARRARAARRPCDVRRADLGVRRRGGGGAARRAGRRPGSARTCACAARASIGSGLELDDETIQLSAFTSDDAGERAFGRIARPSRRR